MDSQQTKTVLTWLERKNGRLLVSSSYYPNQIMHAGQQYGNKDVQALGHALVGYYHGTQNNPSLALEHYLKALALGEQRNDKRIMLRLYHFVSLHGEPRKSIEYLQQVIAFYKQTGEMSWKAMANQQIGNTYLNKLQQYDSALVYLQRAYKKPSNWQAQES